MLCVEEKVANPSGGLQTSNFLSSSNAQETTATTKSFLQNSGKSTVLLVTKNFFTCTIQHVFKLYSDLEEGILTEDDDDRGWL